MKRLSSLLGVFLLVACDAADEPRLGDAQIDSGVQVDAMVAADDSGLVTDGMMPMARFLAQEKDFQDFRQWPSQRINGDIAQVGGHLSGPRTIYSKTLRSSIDGHYAVGAIIVKETNDTPATKRLLFAMVKRGGDYNQDGALGWEWFSLRNRVDGSVAIDWRGFGPPATDEGDGDIYMRDDACNTCHAQGVSTDYVLSGTLP